MKSKMWKIWDTLDQDQQLKQENWKLDDKMVKFLELSIKCLRIDPLIKAC